MGKTAYIKLDRDGWTRGLQLSVDIQDEGGGGHGYRLAGPKYNGSSERVFWHRISERDASEIRRYLDLAFPHSDTQVSEAA